MLGLGEAGTAKRADDLVRDTTTATFMQDVVEESKKQPVLVDFWAPWCGPCKQLTPIIEKAVRAAGGKVKLVKMNIDEHPQVAGQLGVQSIPAVFAFSQGRPVDGFMGALPESQVKAFIDRLVGPSGPSEAEELIAEGEAALAAGDPVTASQAFGEVLADEPDNPKALAGLARAFAVSDNLDQAEATLAMVPADKGNDPAVAAARAQIELKRAAEAVGDLASLERRVLADPADHQARFDLAVGLNAAGRRQQALDHLLDIIRRDRAWNEDGARKQLVQFFEAWGPTDPMTIAGRKQLSRILFS
jgi:putative thioredoxin